VRWDSDKRIDELQHHDQQDHPTARAGNGGEGSGNQRSDANDDNL
jgi:hypothetical protein